MPAKREKSTGMGINHRLHPMGQVIVIIFNIMIVYYVSVIRVITVITVMAISMICMVMLNSWFKAVMVWIRIVELHAGPQKGAYMDLWACM